MCRFHAPLSCGFFTLTIAETCPRFRAPGLGGGGTYAPPKVVAPSLSRLSLSLPPCLEVAPQPVQLVAPPFLCKVPQESRWPPPAGWLTLATIEVAHRPFLAERRRYFLPLEHTLYAQEGGGAA